MRIPIFPHPQQHLLPVFFYYSHLSMKWYLTVVLICISMVANTLSTFSCAYWPFVNFLWKNFNSNSLSSFKFGNFFKLLSFKSIYSVCKSLIRFSNIFFRSMYYLFMFLLLYFAAKQCLIFMKFNLPTFYFVTCALGVLSKKTLPDQGYGD